SDPPLLPLTYFPTRRSSDLHLQRDDPLERRLPGFVNDTHSATSNLFQQFVIAEVAKPAADVGCPGGLRIAWHSGREQRGFDVHRSEEHTSELQSRSDIVCRL